MLKSDPVADKKGLKIGTELFRQLSRCLDSRLHLCFIMIIIIIKIVQVSSSKFLNKNINTLVLMILMSPVDITRTFHPYTIWPSSVHFHLIKETVNLLTFGLFYIYFTAFICFC